ncbi:Prolyl endopeptidase [Strongyloides ratti]|uniref:Prolyl endopeptidase n=1 Tax=Strongyloides ratti TaxID=34506 RepID=A0A090LR42_STRRB|nr:Prolyl endopeptidase [Strongyloides ratti]CEF70642.1 Prolyl endopeptidase [Strongyloides ratti]
MFYNSLLLLNLFFFLIVSISSYEDVIYYGNQKKRYLSRLRINVKKYPVIERNKTCVDVIFDKKIACPYRYLEDLGSDKTLNFVEKVNKLTEKHLYQSPLRELMASKIRMYNSYLKIGLFTKHGEYYYFFVNPGNQTHSLLARKKKITDRYEVFYNIDEEFPAEDRSLQGTCFSKNGDLIAYAFSANGSDWNTIKFRTKNGSALSDEIKNVKFSDMSFIFDKEGFLYSTFLNGKDKPEEVKFNKDENHALFYHKMGTLQKDDVMIAKFPPHKKGAVRGFVSNDEKYLFVKYTEGASEDKHKIFYYKLSELNNNTINKQLKLQLLIGNFDGTYNIIDTYKRRVIVLTTKNAPMGQILKIKLSKSNYGIKEVKDLIKHDENKNIQLVKAIGKKYLLIYCIENVTHHIYVHNKKNGKLITKLHHVQGLVKDITGNTDSNEFFISIENQVTPNIIYRGNLSEIDEGKKNVTMTILFRPFVGGLNHEDFVMDTKFYKSKDGTYIPMFLFHRSDLKLDGKNPVSLYSYGGFGIPFFPQYFPPVLTFVNHFNGIYAIAAVRGGGEYGEKWHKEAILLNKHKSFEDLIAGIEYLIAENYTNPSKMSIHGSANGGIIATVVAQRRPDLIASVITHGVSYDMLRYHKHTSGDVWIHEYGDPEKKKYFNYLLSYSPLQNIRMPVKPHQWPSTFITAGFHDTRVVASHTLIYAAKLYRNLQKLSDYQKNPVLVKIYEGQGNGGVTFRQQLEENIDIILFVAKTLNAKWRISY